MDKRNSHHLGSVTSPFARVTRSSARNTSAASTNSNSTPNPPPPPPGPPSRKRKASPSADLAAAPPQTTKRKRTKSSSKSEFAPPAPPVEPPKSRRKSRAPIDMSDSHNSSAPSDEPAPSNVPLPESTNSKRKSNRKKGAGEVPASSSSSVLPSRSARKTATVNKSTPSKRENTDKAVPDDVVESEDSVASETDGNQEEGRPRAPPTDEMDQDDDLGRPWATTSGASRFESTMRHIHGAISRTMTELRQILENLRSRDDPTLQRLALEELAQTLLMANEDTLAGHFAPEPYIRELIPLMQANEFGEENPEMMLMACRCIANMMEALPSSTSTIVYGGAVPILCQKLLEIHYIDLAEQALSTLEKISVEFPAVIVREGGLTACLTYLDFFATSTQRTAVTTAANCCRNIAEESFPTVRDVMPILQQVLNSSDQKVLEQGCLCVSRIVESFKYQDARLEELVSEDLLKSIIRLLVPGTTNLIGPKIHTSFLKVLAYTARASSRRSVALIKMDVVDTLYQILTGVSPPSESSEMATKIDKVMIMQALIHRPRDQVFETLNVICELLPNVTNEGLHYLDGLFDAGFPDTEAVSLIRLSKKAGNEKRAELLKECTKELRRFTIILFPTLTDAYSSTVNLSVRQKVLTAQLKMISNIDIEILKEALESVSYSSFLATILSQGDHPSLVTYALQAAEVLLKRLEGIYRYQFYREGVFAEIGKLADRPLKIQPEVIPVPPSHPVPPIDLPESTSPSRDSESGANDTIGDMEMEFHDGHDEDHEEEDDGDEDEDENEEDADENEDQEDENEDDEDEAAHQIIERERDSEPSSDSSSEEEYNANLRRRQSMPDPEDTITNRAKKFMELYDNDEGSIIRTQAAEMLTGLETLTQGISDSFANQDFTSGLTQFKKLATYFSTDALASVTSYELLSSKIVDTLLDVISETSPHSFEARLCFLQAFMGEGTQTKSVSANSASPATPFSMFVHKLQDLLSREEHFEVMTVHHNSYDNGRSNSASMLAKQVRLKLVADESSGFPEHFRTTMVTVHALANVKSIAEFLRNRLTIPDRTAERLARVRREGLPHAFAAYAAAMARGDMNRGDRGSPFPPIPLPGELSSRGMPKRSDRVERSDKSKPPKAPAGSSSRRHGGSSAAPPPAPPSLRRSRRNQASPIPPPELPVPNGEEDEEEPIECADETQISSGVQTPNKEALNEIMDALEDAEAMDTEEEPSAVNMEVEAGKLTARREDGTRVATPVSTQKASRSVSTPKPVPAARPMPSTRALSYATAASSVPQDWHLEFTINGQPISLETTIYRVVHFSQDTNEVSARSLLQNMHTLKFKKVDGPPPADSGNLFSLIQARQVPQEGLPESLSRNPTTASILRLLSLLHGLNSHIDDVVAEDKDAAKLVAEPLSQFVNTKLTAKLNRQLEEPLIVASGCLPTWSEDLARLYPFLFPFETRHLFLQSTSFGFARSMTRWQNDQSSSDSRNGRLREERHFLGRLQRQKVRISRARMLESALKVMDMYGQAAPILEVEFFDEVGTGLGPTLEFYATVSKEFSKKKLRLWRLNDDSEDSEYAFGARGLFPAPMSETFAKSDNGKKTLSLFKIMGKFVARSMLDSRIIDISFSPTFFRVGSSTNAISPSLGAVESVDESLARSLRPLKKAAAQKKSIESDENLSAKEKYTKISEITVSGASVEDLSLDFTLPGYPEIELKTNGSDETVTIENLGEYVDKVMDFTLGIGVRRQLEAFQEGFSTVFPYAAMEAFTPDELVMLFGRVEEDWSLETLMDSIKADHGYNLDSKSVRNLLQVMSELSAIDRRDFLQFVTGSPKLPIGGFKCLTPMFTVVCKPSEAPYSSDDYLPSVMTCVNYLKLPDYTDLDVMRKKLGVAMKEGQGAFHLS
ncbi:hypothetical protein BT63DRAFT_423888 [Microthyrium microscopicum]|uniref:HECT-type E3 ubiquitin transferase n=1 Tax=Microthyrium microscopicum TaxID=703497 RepID=A0A6A6UEQ7_9PEZI|nr:hypothetical protein BT63DRAFT_423888 [Microthyrium microscopicum]